MNDSQNKSANSGNIMTSILNALNACKACTARWTLGALLLAPLAAANSSYYALPAVLLLAAFTTVASLTCNDLRKLSELLPPPKTSRGRRERNLQSFADFMALWMNFLSHLVAVAICARILSATADHVTEGRTRRWLFGYETRALGEPWPDVLGVTVVLVLCAMFMCGLEESVMFTFLLLILLYIFSQLFAIFGLIHLETAEIYIPFPITIYELFAACAPISYTFGVIVIKKDAENLKKKLILLTGLPAVTLTLLCFLYANMLKNNSIDAALPVTTLLEARSSEWVCPILAALTVAGVSLAMTELCPLLFTVLVSLASTEWKVLTRSMTYESSTTGSPVLAVFTAGSLAAILAFACPLSHMITLMNASHLLAISLQAYHFIVMRCVPTAEQEEAGDVEYKRLGTQNTTHSTKTSGKKSKRSLWFISSAIRHTKTLESIKSKVIKETEERECLLLDEYAGCPTEEIGPMSSGVASTKEIAAAEVVQSDIEIISDPESSSGDDSTDIDAVVKEYKDTIQVVTTAPEATAPTPPSTRGARWAAAGGAVQVTAAALIATAFCSEALRIYMLTSGIPLWLTGLLMSSWYPAHKLGGGKTRQVLQGPVTMLTALLLLTPLLLDSWPAIILFAGAGVVIYARCERWCGDLALQQARGSIRSRKLRPDRLSSARLTHLDTVYIAR